MTIKKQVLFMLVCFAVIPMLVGTILTMYTSVDTIQNLHVNRLDKLAHTSASAFSEIVGIYKQELGLLSSSNVIADYLHVKEDKKENEKTIDSIQQYLKVYVERIYAVKDVVLLNEHGIVIAGYHKETLGKSLAQYNYYIEAQKLEHDILVSQITDALVKPNDPKEKSLAISKALYTKDNKLAGVLVSFIDIDVLGAFSKSITFGKTGLAFVVDSENYILYHPEARFYNSHTAAPKLSRLYARYQAGEISPSGAIIDTMEGVKRIYYYVVMKDDSLILILRQDYAEYSKERDNTFLVTATMIIATILVALYFGIKFSRKFTHPILELQNAFSSGKDTGTYVKCDLQLENELGDMAVSYNKMIETLQEQFQLVEKERAKNEYIAHHDSITGLYNRIAFENKLNEVIGDKIQCGILFIDVDNFKEINDVLGHPIGDALLKEFGELVCNSKGNFDICSRVGGDEFSLLKKGSRDDIKKAVEQLFIELSEPFEIEGKMIFITISVGIELYTQEDDNSSKLIKNADIAMYEAKRFNGNRYCFFTDQMYYKILHQSKIMQVLQHCIENEEIYLVYQPAIEISTNKIVAFEALTRIQSRELGFIGPAEFIPIIEKDSNLVTKIGNKIVKSACMFINDLVQNYGFEGVVSINVSGTQIREESFVDYIKEVLKTTGLPAKHLQIEIKENMLMENLEEVSRKLTELQSEGITVAVDDFGTFYSSYNYLIHFPLDVIKIDRLFFQNILTDEKELSVNKSIIQLAHSIGLKVVAERVEIKEHYDLFKELGCDMIQGYLFSRPLIEEDVILKLKEDTFLKQ